MEIKYLLAALIAGYLLDLLLGDPRWLPHPIVAFGAVISFTEKYLNIGKHKFINGIITGATLPLATYTLFLFVEDILQGISPVAFAVYSAIGLFFGLANRSLIQEGKAVLTALTNEGIVAGRKRLSWIVGRDTSNLSEQQIYTAVFETLSENLSDGVIAPLFYYAIGGVPGIMAYKMINTLDSMIAYKNERYKKFGYFSAKLDDIANFIPARLTALLMIIVSANIRVVITVKKYAHQHVSPNSGYPESALAGILKCRFGGPNQYLGKTVTKPYIGDNPRTLSMNDFNTVRYINHASTILMVACTAAWYLVLT